MRTTTSTTSSFFFYDLETSGFNPREARIMQFAGQRTDLQLKPIGDPHNYLIRMSDDVLPEPDAVLITGITPQKTLAEGMHEAEFLKVFHEEIATPGTIFVGFNTIRFDDEFMRFLNYRNFYDPYEWQWQNGRSKWDLLDVVRMTRALRPDGIKWPVDSKGKPTNRLELLTSLNGLGHDHAHDALSDVTATIAVAQLIRTTQPKLFDYLLTVRDKKSIASLVMDKKPFVYASGKYPGEFEKTTVASVLAEHPQGGAALVFDLRHDPALFLEMDAAALAEAWRWRPPTEEEGGPRLPVKTMKFNRCPAVAPLGVLDAASQQRLKLDPKVFTANYKKLQAAGQQFSQKVLEALQLMDKKQQARLLEDESDVDARLYEDFFAAEDKAKMSMVRGAGAEGLSSLNVRFKDGRLEALLPLYKARNYPKSLSDEERATWERFRERKLMGGGEASRAARYFARLSELAKQPNLTGEQQYLLEELQLYGQSILPTA
ncbi:MAG TPA: exodeoxyribonuclease I [Candidatus Limnocylindria bacterium]|nr:exodeoxyribonuclease I [Candidatus Limnocylindria bacterium]